MGVGTGSPGKSFCCVFQRKEQVRQGKPVGFWVIKSVPSCPVVFGPGVIGKVDSGPELESQIEKAVEYLSSGLVDLHMKGMLQASSLLSLGN